MWSITQASTGMVENGITMTQTINTWAQDQDIIANTDDLDVNLTRAQAAQLYLNIAKQQRWTGKIIQLMSGNTNTWCVFADIKDNSYARIITIACQRWIMKWDNGLFKPNNTITPLESLVTLMRITHGAQDEDSNPRYQSYINLALRKNIITQSDISLINSGSSISTNQILTWTYANSHDMSPSWIQKITQTITKTDTNSGAKVAWDANKSTNKRNWLKWLKWLLFTLIIRGLLRRLGYIILWDRSSTRTITWDKPIWVYDDLTIVEGIGPKVQQILYDNDILTYDSLSRLTAWHISNIISPYGTTYESMNPVTWPRQAQLARDGQRDELEILKQELKKWI
jgi:S-layer homology domain